MQTLRRIGAGFLLVAALLLATSCGGNKSCKDGCDKLSSCNLNSSGFSCDNSCGAPDDTCAVCVNDKACDEIIAGKCASDCPKATFTRK
jgi:hypothetical protein